MKELIAMYHDLVQQGPAAQAVLVTIIKTEGSTFQKKGARALWHPGQPVLGMLSGGCVEKALVQAMENCLTLGRPTKYVYDSTDPMDAIFGFGEGCQGRTTMLLEPLLGAIPPDQLWPMLAFHPKPLEEPVASGAVRVVTRVQGDLDEVRVVRDLVPTPPSHEAAAANGLCLGEEENDLLVEQVRVPPEMLIYGTSPLIDSLCAQMKLLGWTVQRCEGALDDPQGAHGDGGFRKHDSQGNQQLYGTSSRFQGAFVGTHQFLKDVAIIEYLLAQGHCAYIGVLGSNGRRQAVCDALRLAALPPHVHMPAGNKLLSRGPEMIALGIATEIAERWLGY